MVSLKGKGEKRHIMNTYKESVYTIYKLYEKLIEYLDSIYFPISDGKKRENEEAIDDCYQKVIHRIEIIFQEQEEGFYEMRNISWKPFDIINDSSENHFIWYEFEEVGEYFLTVLRKKIELLMAKKKNAVNLQKEDIALIREMDDIIINNQRRNEALERMAREAEYEELVEHGEISTGYMPDFSFLGEYNKNRVFNAIITDVLTTIKNGAYYSTIILCGSIMEMLLWEIFMKKEIYFENTKENPITLKTLIDESRKKLNIEMDIINKMHQIRKYRNYVHWDNIKHKDLNFKDESRKSFLYLKKITDAIKKIY